jgi:hypothetical protein
MTATEPKDEKDLKRACVVLSKGREVVGPGYSRLTGANTTVTDRGENLGNYSRVNWVCKMEQHYPSRVSLVSRLGKTTTRNGKQIGLAGLAKIAAWINEQIRLAG